MNKEDNTQQLNACCSPAEVTKNNAAKRNPCCVYSADGTSCWVANASKDANVDKTTCC